MKITMPGDYATRDGRRVTVRDIRGPATACVRGQIWKEFRGAVQPRGNHAWTEDGMFHFIGTHRADIVSVWPGHIEHG